VAFGRNLAKIAPSAPANSAVAATATRNTNDDGLQLG
jgi:hypothetical protein